MTIRIISPIILPDSHFVHHIAGFAFCASHCRIRILSITAYILSLSRCHRLDPVCLFSVPLRSVFHRGAVSWPFLPLLLRRWFFLCQLASKVCALVLLRLLSQQDTYCSLYRKKTPSPAYPWLGIVIAFLFVRDNKSAGICNIIR
ncbi:hypothetical protein O6H91_Y539500 [Diphasiastrum complanatum]|nr:hypothetical protein O6H91_Y324400 [Diphasiastrum complanatum]KAJ7298588.1 hypothetical protein O6H91_Y539500 [Diphasiastrum complanatum]